MCYSNQINSSFCHMQRVNQFVLVVLVVLLAGQLTGLTCLNDWMSTGSTAESLSLQTDRLPDGSLASGQQNEDGCPCHLVFHAASLGSGLVSPLTDSPPGVPVPFVCSFPHSLFHPPLAA